MAVDLRCANEQMRSLESSVSLRHTPGPIFEGGATFVVSYGRAGALRIHQARKSGCQDMKRGGLNR